MIGKYEDTALSARYQALEHYPAGSLGRAYWEYCRANGFALPGEKDGAAEPILFHDCAHVLSGYGTEPEGEVQVACFSAGFQRRDPWLFVFFVLLQFHVGIRMTPITKARTGFFDPAKALVDGPQALLLAELPHFLEDVALARDTYLKRSVLASKYRPH